MGPRLVRDYGRAFISSSNKGFRCRSAPAVKSGFQVNLWNYSQAVLAPAVTTDTDFADRWLAPVDLRSRYDR